MKKVISEGPEAFTRFRDAMQKILSIPRDEFLRREAEYKEHSALNPRKRGPKTPRAGGMSSADS
jgi:hypothetical protein